MSKRTMFYESVFGIVPWLHEYTRTRQNRAAATAMLQLVNAELFIMNVHLQLVYVSSGSLVRMIFHLAILTTAAGAKATCRTRRTQRNMTRRQLRCDWPHHIKEERTCARHEQGCDLRRRTSARMTPATEMFGPHNVDASTPSIATRMRA